MHRSSRVAKRRLGPGRSGRRRARPPRPPFWPSAAPAFAATTTLYASPSGSGSSCSASQPCSLTGAQAAVRSMVGSMSGDIVVQLADGVYRMTSPLTFTAADSGTNGHTVVWQAAASAHPVISGAKAVTGWTLADSSKNIWRASVGAGLDTRQLYVNGAEATRARTALNRSDFTATTAGLKFTNSALSYLNNVANQNRVEVEAINSFTDRYSPVQSIAGNLLTMQQPAWNNNTFGYDTLTSPFRAGPMYAGERVRVPRLAGRVVREHLHRAPSTTSRCPGRA